MHRIAWALAVTAAAGHLGCQEPSGLSEPSFPPAVLAEEDSPPVRVGLDRVAAGEFDFASGARAGLVAHAASVTANGRHAIDVLRESGVEIVRLFAPEHGLRGRAAAGAHVEDGRDLVSGLPVVSLYGEKRQPGREDLADLDLLIFDLQGAGVRFYTYVSTLISTLGAVADAGIELVVLDRPNPLGGESLAGPVSAPRDTVAESFVNLAPGPLVHGLTLGEMARFVNARRDRPARLRVLPMSGWHRSMIWADTGRRWVAPSPNLRSPEAALAYPGIALFEATNVSEGRGTATPFLLFGAPWLDRASLAVAPDGIRLVPVEFTPGSGPAAPRPKYLDELCSGFKVEVSNGREVAGYRVGLELLTAIFRQEGFEWRNEGRALTWLLGTPEVFEAIRDGKSAAQIVAADAADHARWLSQRRASLLY